MLIVEMGDLFRTTLSTSSLFSFDFEFQISEMLKKVGARGEGGQRVV